MRSGYGRLKYQTLSLRWLTLAGLLLVLPAVADDLDGLADPSRPSWNRAVSDDTPSGLVLQSTQVSPQQQVAVISGQRVMVGARVGGAEVVAIKPFEVVLRRSGKDTVLRLLPRLNVEKNTIEAVPDANNP